MNLKSLSLMGSENSLRMLKRILLSVWLLGLAFAIPVILLLPDLFNKYKTTLVLQEPAAQADNYRVIFRDLDGNGVTQKIYSFRNRAGQLSCQYFGDNGEMVNQINFSHTYTNNVPLVYVGDANNNNKLEIYGFTLGRDSLFLNWAELVTPLSNRTKSLFITRIGLFEKNKLDFTISRFNVLDLDNDGDDEIIFSIITGYSRYPRTVVVYHPETGRLVTSEDVGVNPYFMVYYDLDRDGTLEIITGSNVGYHQSDSTGTPIEDIRPYIRSFDHEMKEYWPPIPFTPGIENTLHIMPELTNKREILVFQFNRGRPRDKIVGVYTVDFQGNVRDSAFFPEYGKRFRYQVYPGTAGFWLYTGDKMVKIDDHLQVVAEKTIDPSAQMYRNPVRAKGCPEMATSDLLSGTVCLYTEDFDYKVVQEYSSEIVRNVILETGRGPDHFMVQTDNNEYIYRFGKNFLFYLKYPVYLFIYALSVFFVWLIQSLREKQLSEKYEIQAQMRDLEIKSLRMQMDPHFMFNAFNSMALLLKNGNREEAYEAFMKFSRMVRSNFDFSDRFTRPLSEEIDMTRQYLELNKLRFKDKLEFSIDVDRNVPMNSLIPKMILQIHVENALKHGLAKLDKTGRVTIDVSAKQEELLISVEDNGVGRQKAAQLNPGSTRQGLKMLKAIFDRLNLQGKSVISQDVIDLKDEAQNPAGTRVVIRVPLGLRESREGEPKK